MTAKHSSSGLPHPVLRVRWERDIKATRDAEGNVENPELGGVWIHWQKDVGKSCDPFKIFTELFSLNRSIFFFLLLR